MSELTSNQHDIETKREFLRQLLAKKPLALVEEHKTSTRNECVVTAPPPKSRARVQALFLQGRVETVERKTNDGLKKVEQTRCLLMVLSPTAAYATDRVSRQSDDPNSQTFYSVNKERDQLTLYADESSTAYTNRKANLVTTQAQFLELENKTVVYEGQLFLTLTFDGDFSNIPELSKVEFCVRASASFPTVLRDSDNGIYRARIYVNGSALTLVDELSGDEWNDQLCGTPEFLQLKMPPIEEIIDEDNWTAGDLRRYSSRVFFVATAKSARLATSLFYFPDGWGYTGQLHVNAQDPKAFGYSKQTDSDNAPLHPGLRFRISARVHSPHQAEILLRNMRLDAAERVDTTECGTTYQYLGNLWNTTGFAICSAVGWEMLAKKIFDKLDIMMAFKVAIEDTQSDPNEHNYIINPVAVKTNIGNWLYENAVPVSWATARAWAKSGYYCQEAPDGDMKHSFGPRGPAVVPLNEIGAHAGSFLDSDTIGKYCFRAISAEDISDKLRAMIKEFIAVDAETGVTLEQKYAKEGKCMLGAVFDCDYDREEAEKTQQKFFGESYSPEKHALQDSHPLLQKNVRPLIGSRDLLETGHAFFVFAIDTERLQKGSLGNNKQFENFLCASQPTQLAIEPAKPTKKRARSPELAAVPANDESTQTDDDNSDQLSVGEGSDNDESSQSLGEPPAKRVFTQKE